MKNLVFMYRRRNNNTQKEKKRETKQIEHNKLSEEIKKRTKNNFFERDFLAVNSIVDSAIVSERVCFIMSSAADDSLPDEFDLIVIGTGETIANEILKKNINENYQSEINAFKQV